MASWNWNGARWWKFDLHTHTPASADYGKGPGQSMLRKREPKNWLLDYMRAGIDCVAITDHNTGAWVDDLGNALRKLETEKPAGYRPLHLFPGTEISVHGGVHLLAILPRSKGTPDIDSLLGAARFSGTKGSSNDVTSEPFGDVVAKITAKGVGGIAIPAHVDREGGLFKLRGETLGQAIQSRGVFAMEVVDPRAERPSLFSERDPHWTEVLGSDAHHPSGTTAQRYPGSHFTWVKMGCPTIEGLRLALLDGKLSILRSDRADRDPNEHAPLVLESIEVAKARYMGRAQPFLLGFNPWLNAIVGGRGTGKSTLVEFLRLALRRVEELPDDLRPELDKYGNVYSSRKDGGLLTEETTIRVVYRKDGSRFRIQWSPAGNLEAIEEEKGGGWRCAEGEVTQRFPVRMYSQKQVFHLAKTPLALLRIVDEAPEVDRRSWKDRWNQEEVRYLSLRARAREIQAELEEEPRLRGQLDDVKRKLAIFEDAGHADVLKAFQRRRRQQRAVESWEEGWAGTGERLREMARDLVPDALEDASLDTVSKEDAELCEVAARTRHRIDRVGQELEGLAQQVDEILSTWQEERDRSAWKNACDAAVRAYDSLRERLAEEGAGDPSTYGELVQGRQNLERRLRNLGENKLQVASLEAQAETSLKKLLEIRRDLTDSRRSFLREVLQGNDYVRIEIVPYGARETGEEDFRRLIQRQGGGFEKDIGSPETGGLLGEIYSSEKNRAEDIEKRLARLKQRVRSLADGLNDPGALADQRFARHLERLPPEALDRLDLWFPEDSLAVQYSPTGDGRNLRSIQEGSPGQKTAALLAFLLSYGEEPLVLDQPEDDLDNHLIYDLIVTQLREVKRRRQVIVVTHNPNLVVNGDAELVVALAARGGETQEECEGSLQEKSVRDTICEVMEGGREAFEERYRRIALEGRRV